MLVRVAVLTLIGYYVIVRLREGSGHVRASGEIE